MIEADFINLITNAGFPIAVCVYFMWITPRIMRTIESNTQAIDRLTNMVYQMAAALKTRN